MIGLYEDSHLLIFFFSETYEQFIKKRDSLLQNDDLKSQYSSMNNDFLVLTWLLTNGERMRHGMIDDAHCVQCGEPVKCLDFFLQLSV